MGLTSCVYVSKTGRERGEGDGWKVSAGLLFYWYLAPPSGFSVLTSQ